MTTYTAESGMAHFPRLPFCKKLKSWITIVFRLRVLGSTSTYTVLQNHELVLTQRGIQPLPPVPGSVKLTRQPTSGMI